MKKITLSLLILLTFSALSLKAQTETTTTTTTVITTVQDAPPPPPPQQQPQQQQEVVTVQASPPDMPVYEQPICPVSGYIWTPGYWAYGVFGYYWVPGVWVAPPRPGLLWTPSWWGFSNGYYGYHAGYWAPVVGYYGGINYGYGYGGYGYGGGRWNNGYFEYNTAISRVDNTIVRNTYEDRTVIVVDNNARRSSYNGPGGYTRAATETELSAARSPQRVNYTTEQQSHQTTSREDKSLAYSSNQGHPEHVTMDRVGGNAYSEKGVQTTRAATPAPAAKPANLQPQLQPQRNTAPQAPAKPQGTTFQQPNNATERGQVNTNQTQQKLNTTAPNGGVQQNKNMNKRATGNNTINQKQNNKAQQKNQRNNQKNTQRTNQKPAPQKQEEKPRG